MATQDTCCTIVPYFKVPAGKMEVVKKFCEEFMEMAKSEPDCLYYGFSFNGDQLHSREGHKNADGLLAHVANVGEKLGELLKIIELTRLEVHGPAGELAKLKEPLAAFGPQFYTLEYGFRR